MSGVTLFVYGTLMADDCVLAVTGRRFRRAAAVLENYVRITPPRGFPHIIPQPGDRVSGSVLFGIDPASLKRLDRYEDEGRLYLRTPVEARCGDERVACHAYVGVAGDEGRPSAFGLARKARRRDSPGGSLSRPP